MTPAEKKLWYEFLCGCGLPVYRQKPIGKYIVDFYCPARKLVIEIDGDSHYESEAKKRDEIRTKTLNSFALQVMRFTNIEVLSNFEGVCTTIDQICGNES